MREIKFRVWDNNNKVMQSIGVLEWLNGGIKPYGQGSFVNNNEGFVDEKSIFLMQYTNLKDKNGKEIYEDDIVRVYDIERYCICNEWEECNGKNDKDHRNHGEHKHEKYGDCDKYICTQKIKWNYYTGYFCEEDTGEYCPALGSDEIELEIIGNIYENPELLK